MLNATIVSRLQAIYGIGCAYYCLAIARAVAASYDAVHSLGKYPAAGYTVYHDVVKRCQAACIQCETPGVVVPCSEFFQSVP